MRMAAGRGRFGRLSPKTTRLDGFSWRVSLLGRLADCAPLTVVQGQVRDATRTAPLVRLSPFRSGLYSRERHVAAIARGVVPVETEQAPVRYGVDFANQRGS